MLNFIEIIKTEQTLLIKTPYYPPFNRNARKLNGKWKDPYWQLDVRLEPQIKEICLRLFGEYQDDPPRTTCLVNMNLVEDKQEICMLGRTLVSRPSRDQPVQLANSVAIIQGDFPNSGGSNKYPLVQPFPNTILKVFDTPLRLALRWIQEHDSVTLQQEITTQENPALTLARSLINQLPPNERATLIKDLNNPPELL